MALVLNDRVLETCTSPGTGAVPLLGAATGYRTFSVGVGNTNTCYYAISDQSGSNWEVGVGTYSSAGNTLARTTVLSSSNGGSLTNFSSGTQNVYVTYPSEKAVYLDANPTFPGYMGLSGVSALSNVGLGVGLASGISPIGITVTPTFTTAVTGNPTNYYSQMSVAASATPVTASHFIAGQGTYSGASWFLQQGFVADSTLISATNNYGFVGNIPAGTNRYNLYISGTADNYINGRLGIGTAPYSNLQLLINGTVTSTVTTANAVLNTTASDTNTSNTFSGFYAQLSTSTTALTNLFYYVANQGAFSGTVTNQIGYQVTATLTGATNNYGFYSGIPAGTNRFNFYAQGTADNFFGGKLGIGALPGSRNDLLISSGSAHGTAPQYLLVQSGVQSDATSVTNYFASFAGTAAASFTSAQITHFSAAQGTFGAGSTVTNQVGFQVVSGVIGATNNYGFIGDIPAGTNRFNLYMGGTASNYMAGSLGIGTVSLTGIALGLAVNMGSAVSIQVYNSAQVTSAVTNYANYFKTAANTQAATFTCPVLGHYVATQGVFGAGSVVTNQYGFFVDTTLIGATNNIGVYSAIASAVNRFNFYAAGTADNYFAGRVLTNAATATPAGGSTSAYLQMGATTGFGIYYGSGAPTVSAPQGSIYIRSDGSSTSTRMYVNTTGSTTWTNLVTAA